MTFELVEPSRGAKIKVIGLGGAGGNAVNNMIVSGLDGVEFIVANTDVQDLDKSKAPTKIQIGCDSTRGLGAGADPDLGRRAAEENLDSLRNAIDGADMVFITCGLGGGTGTGSAPVVANVAKEQGALTVVVATKPFHFEGKKRMAVAEAGGKELKGRVDTLITIPNNRLLAAAPKNATLLEMFARADDILYQAVRGVSDLINSTGQMNADFNDLRRVMLERGLALMGTGVGIGENRAVEAANLAISSPLLEDIAIDGATGLMINITSGPDLTITEYQDAISLVQKEADEEAEVITGWVVDEQMEDEIRVTVIATGIGPKEDHAARSDMSDIRRQAVAELKRRASNDDLDWPAYLREDEEPAAAQAAAGGGPNPSSEAKFDPNDYQIPTFLRRCAD